jgi:basic membrane protein A and related proteins
MALPGSINDQGFNESNYDGLKMAEASLHVKGSVVDNVPAGQAEVNALEDLAKFNQLVIGVGAQFAAAGVTVAPEYPKVQFAIVNGQLSPGVANLHVYEVREGVPAYIAGVLAAHLTRTKTIGYVGGTLIPPTVQSNIAFEAGARSVDPSIKYRSINTGDFENISAAKNATATEISQGADVIFAMLDAGLQGAVEAVQASGKKVLLFQIITYNCSESPDIVGSAYLSSADFEFSIIREFLDKKLPSKMQSYGVQDPAVQTLKLCPRWQSQSLTKQVDGLTQQINSGQIRMPPTV